MKDLLKFITIALFCAVAAASSDASGKLKIGIKKRIENCTVKTRKGDLVHMHYTVSSSVYFLKIFYDSLS